MAESVSRKLRNYKKRPGEDIPRECPWETDTANPFHGEVVNNTYEIVARQAKIRPSAPCLGWRPRIAQKFGPYKWHSYETTRSLATRLGTALAELGLKKGDKIGLYAKNCPNWALVELAAASQGMVLVPLYDTLGTDAVRYISKHAEIKAAFSSPVNLKKLMNAFAGTEGQEKLAIEHVIVFEREDVQATDATKNLISSFKEKILTFEDVVGMGTDEESRLNPGTMDDLLVIMYTSGTTGLPKGVTLKNSALLSSVTSALRFFEHWGIDFNSTHDFSVLSYLPLAHILEQQVEATCFATGGKVGYYTGDIKLLLDDLEALKPTFFVGVPRVFARFQQRIQENVDKASFLVRKLFQIGYNRQLNHVREPRRIGRSRLWDILVFSKIRARLLPECKLVITGSAPMSEQTNDFLKICLMCPVVQGYGLTETVGGMVCSAPGYSVSGSCGGPLPGVVVKLVDVPEMEYTSRDLPRPRGEICVKGAIVTSGYFKNDKETSEAFDENGYFHTGDIGQWLEDGCLQIIDRKKNLFKLSQGEYVSPENLEQEYQKAKLVSQIWVYGDSLQNYLVAVVVPDLAAAKEAGYPDKNTLSTNPEFKKEVLEQLAHVRKAFSFKGYEAIKDCLIETRGMNELGQAFNVDNDLMTPTFKLKRPQLKKRYKARLDALYAAM